MKLSETDQLSLMDFIKKIITDKRDSNDENINENENEIMALRKSNNLLVAQIAKLDLDLEAGNWRKYNAA